MADDCRSDQRFSCDSQAAGILWEPFRGRRHMPRGGPGSLPRPLVFLDGVAAVDDDHLAGQVTALVAGKVERESTQLVWPSGPADGRVLARHQEFLAAAAVLDPARGDRGRGYAVGPGFEGAE